MSELPDKGTLMVQILGDRLAMLIALCDDSVIELWLEGRPEDEAWWSQLKQCILSTDDGSMYRQNKLRESTFFRQAKQEVKQMLSAELRKRGAKARGGRDGKKADSHGG